jgi:5-methylcytosine-specific restriction endonuclease McrA
VQHKGMIKSPRLHLNPANYKKLRFDVLRRDGWRCQMCGSKAAVEVHHLVHRSQRGSDIETNLTTLCSNCHTIVHRGG